MNENDTIKSLVEQARNTKHLVDLVNLAYMGMTTNEIIKLALSKEGGNDGNKNRNTFI